MAKKAGLVWVDAQGQRVLHVVTTDTGVGGIETALEAASRAGVVECWEGLDETYSPSPATDTYPTVRVTAVLTFSDGAGSNARLLLPAPNDSIFLSDGRTVDPGNPLVIDIINAAVGNLLAGSGLPVVSFEGGQLLQSRLSGIATLP